MAVGGRNIGAIRYDSLCSVVVNSEGGSSTGIPAYDGAWLYTERRRVPHHSENRKMTRIQNVRRDEGPAGSDWSASSSMAVTSSLSSYRREFEAASML